MTLRTMTSAFLTLTLAACSGAEDPDTPCCAILPKNQCQDGLSQAGLTNAELELLLGPVDKVCPSTTLSEARIRKLAAIWNVSQACGAARGRDRLLALDSGLCAIQTGLKGPVAAEGLKP